MNDDLRSLLVRLLDAVDSAPTADDIPFPLRGLFEELRAELIAGKGLRDRLAGAVGSPLSLPTEPLFLTPQFAALNRAQWRLFAASHLLAGALPDAATLSARNGHAKLAADAVCLADTLVRVNDGFDRQPPASCQTQPPPPASSPPPVTPEAADTLTGDELDYLLWLATAGPAGPSDHPPAGTMAFEDAADAKRSLIRRGFVVACVLAGGGYGCEVGPLGRAAMGTMRLAEAA